MDKKIGIVGCGFVGQAIFNAFKPSHETRGYDVNSQKKTHSLEEVLECDFVFVCLPTPMSEDGSCNTSIIFEFFKEIQDIRKKINSETIYIIKSTVPVGTTRQINKEFGFEGRIVHSAEFLSAKTSNIDFITAPRYLVGGEKSKSYACERVSMLHKNRFPHAQILEMSFEESELTKYLCNCFYSTKILFMNEMKLFSDHLDLNWENIMNGFLSSGWVSPMHTDVPGHDGKPGFGGACFPKDTNSLAHQFKEHGLNSSLLDTVIKRNSEIRNEH